VPACGGGAQAVLGGVCMSVDARAQQAADVTGKRESARLPFRTFDERRSRTRRHAFQSHDVTNCAAHAAARPQPPRCPPWPRTPGASVTHRHGTEQTPSPLGRSRRGPARRGPRRSRGGGQGLAERVGRSRQPQPRPASPAALASTPAPRPHAAPQDVSRVQTQHIRGLDAPSVRWCRRYFAWHTPPESPPSSPPRRLRRGRR